MTKPSEAQASVPKQAIEAFVLAGARSAGDALAQAHNVASKAHIQIAGVSMISRVLRALSKSQTVAEATIIGLDDKAALGSEDYSISIRFTEGANGPAASVDQALRTRKEPEPILVTTCDHALLSPDIIDTFLDRALTSGADVAVALARRETIEGDYPDATRTYLRFGDGDYSSCNLFCLMSPAAGDVVKFWQRAEQDRKRPWRIAWR
ncbi:MAG: nucleotidyltransferase family protein, partial [Pseudomonadota bacterium]